MAIFYLALSLMLQVFSLILAGNHEVTVNIDTTEPLAQVDEHFVCATLDWWPDEKRDFDQFTWNGSSVLNLDLSHPLLSNAISAFSGGLRIRLGGSLQDQVVYDVSEKAKDCKPFSATKDQIFNFSGGCLTMHRWNELYEFLQSNGAIVTFGLNALSGRNCNYTGGACTGDWNPKNALDFINYALSKNQMIDSWEFGNELCSGGIHYSVNATQYRKDVIGLKKAFNKLNIVAPGGFFEEQWFSEFLKPSQLKFVDALSIHIYNLPRDDKVRENIMNPSYSDGLSNDFKKLKDLIHNYTPGTRLWVGEAGGVPNSGLFGVSDRFINSFWYLDQLGLASKNGVSVYCRQALVGGNYGLLDKKTFHPNPDYYSALLFHRLMGRHVFRVLPNRNKDLKVYAHCTKNQSAVSVMILNYNKNDTFQCHFNLRCLFRDEYHLTAEGDLTSSISLLNGRPLHVTGGNIPDLRPNTTRNLNSPVHVAPLSIAFVVFYYINSCPKRSS